MAATKRPNDAFQYAKSFVKGMTLEDVNVEILDEVNKMIWMAAPWRWTLGSLPATQLVSNTPDYTITTPADFLFIFDGYISDGANVFRNLIFEPTLPADVVIKGDTSRIAYMGSDLYRLYPRPGTIPATPGRQLILRYKKNSPEITNETQFTSGFLEMDDEWFWVYSAGVLHKAYQWADDSRAGSATLSEGKVQYTGQLAIFRDGIRQMTEKEKLPLLDQQDTVTPKAVNK